MLGMSDRREWELGISLLGCNLSFELGIDIPIRAFIGPYIALGR
jgi:hypothetical protein